MAQDGGQSAISDGPLDIERNLKEKKNVELQKDNQTTKSPCQNEILFILYYSIHQTVYETQELAL